MTNKTERLNTQGPPALPAIGIIVTVAFLAGLTGYLLVDHRPALATVPAEARVPPQLEPRMMAPPLPQLAELPAGPQRKEAFVDYLTPVAEAVNEEVLRRRAALLLVEQRLQQDEALSPAGARWLEEMSLRYRVGAEETDAQLQALKERIDVIPVSLVLAQGALESNWGTSRFAREGNNIFGKWCFTAGCGIVPGRRAAGATHEVEAYGNVANSVRAYVHHLNSHPVYEPLRALRVESRDDDQPLDGSRLAGGLEHYSARGKDYVESLRQVIRVNGLDQVGTDDSSSGP